MIQSSAQTKAIRLKKIESQQANEIITMKIQLNNFTTEKSRVHLYATQFCPNIPLSLRNTLEESGTSNISGTNFPFAIWRNMFESDIQIGDEIRYVFDR